MQYQVALPFNDAIQKYENSKHLFAYDLLNFKLSKVQAHYVASQVLKDHPEQAEALLKRWLPEAPRYAYV